MDGLPSKAQPYGTDAELALAQLQLYEHLYNDTLFQRSEQWYGAILQFVVSFQPIPLPYDRSLLTFNSFQEVQGHTAIETSLRILPALITAVLSNLTTGYFVNRISVTWVVLISAALTAISPLLMALIDPQYPYWSMAFTAQVSEARTYCKLVSLGLAMVL